MPNGLKKKSKKILENWLGIPTIVLLVLVVVCSVTYLIFHMFHWWELSASYNNKSNIEDYNVIEIHSVALIWLTIGLISIAWFQLHKTNKNLRGEFLLKVDERFASPEVAKAEKLIQALCWKHKVKNVLDDDNIKKVSEEIKKIAENEMYNQKTIEKDSEDATYLLNFLDFLETIAYFWSEGLVSKEEINETLGGTIVYYYKIFQDLIDYQRIYLNRPKYYCSLEKVVKEINDCSTE